MPQRNCVAAVGYISRNGAERNGTKVAELLRYKPLNGTTFKSFYTVLGDTLEDDCLYATSEV